MKIRPEKLKDPLVARWALERVKYAREIEDHDRLDELSQFFNESTFVHIIEEGDERLTAELLVNIPYDWFASIEKYLLENWLSWKGIGAYWSAKRIAELAPQEFLEVLDSYAESPDILLDENKILGAFDAVAGIGEDAAPIAKTLLARVESEGTKETWRFLLSNMVSAAASCGMEESIALLARGFEIAEQEHEGKYLIDVLSAAYRTIAPNLPYFSQIVDILQNVGPRFTSIPELFIEDAPLKAMDKACAKGEKIIAAALELLPNQDDASEVVMFARRLALATPDVHNKSSHEMLACFLLASTAAHYARKTFAFENYSPDALLGIASYDVIDLPCYKETLHALKNCLREEIAPLMIKALQEAQDHYGGTHLAAMMGDLGYPEFIEPLMDCMGKNSADFLAESAMAALAKIGGEASRTIMSQWNSLDDSQRIFGHGVLQHMSGDANTIQFLKEHFAEARVEPGKLEFWCSTAETVPDRTLLRMLERELHRELDVVDDSYCTLCALLDVDNPEQKNARERIERRKGRMLDKSLADMTAEELMDQPAKIELHCHSCGETNQFPMPDIYVSPKHPKEGFCVGGDLKCPSCHCYGPFESDSMAMLAVTAELIKLTYARESGVEYHGPIKFINAPAHDGRNMSPTALVKDYLQRLERFPESVPDLLGLGNFYNNIGSCHLAAGYYDRCLSIGSECVEAAYSLASIRFDDGDVQTAFKILDNAWRVKDRWRYYRLKQDLKKEFLSNFVEFYNSIAPRSGKLKFSNMESPASLAPVRKVGRNDPCPCGSGKKYKKCCGPKEGL